MSKMFWYTTRWTQYPTNYGLRGCIEQPYRMEVYILAPSPEGARMEITRIYGAQSPISHIEVTYEGTVEDYRKAIIEGLLDEGIIDWNESIC
jgi:hypothetical protein